MALHAALDGDERAVLIGHDWGAEATYGAAAIAPERWRRLVTIGVPPLTLDARMFADYDQLKRIFYVFFLKTHAAEPVIAADDMAFIDRLWQDWSPGYDAAEDVRMAKQCLRSRTIFRPPSPTTEPTSPDSIPPARATRLPPSAKRAPNPATADALSPRRPRRQHRRRPRPRRRAPPRARLADRGIEDTGHFLHLERPSAVNKRILSWLSALA